jgi:HK97 family phage prohead protease
MQTNINISSKTGVCYGYASIFDIKDLQRDIILRGSIKNTKQHKNIPILLEHRNNNKIGSVTKILEDKVGLYVEGIINDQYVLRNDLTNMSFSIGFYSLSEYVIHEEKGRIIGSMEISEISLVKKPASNCCKAYFMKK